MDFRNSRISGAAPVCALAPYFSRVRCMRLLTTERAAAAEEHLPVAFPPDSAAAVGSGDLLGSTPLIAAMS